LLHVHLVVCVCVCGGACGVCAELNDYFSYEHFYVIYCRFWELDEDHDGLIDAHDLIQYDDYALTNRVVERIMSGAGRRLLSTVPGKVNTNAHASSSGMRNGIKPSVLQLCVLTLPCGRLADAAAAAVAVWCACWLCR
jgi:hypothetical protein